MSETVNRKNRERSEAEKKRRPFGIARRSIWYLLRWMLVITLTIFLCYFALVEMFYVSNIYIITSEGMEKRADCVLGETDANSLQEYFVNDWILQDELLMTQAYHPYRVESYDHRLSFEAIKVFPWSKTATVRVVERVKNIQAKPKNEATVDPAPAWDNAQMELKLEKIDGRWFIVAVEILTLDPEGKPAATPDYSQLTTDVPHY